MIREEEALSLPAAQLAIILSEIADGITVQEPTGRLIYANAAAARIIGYPSVQALLATPLADVMRQFEMFDEAGRPVSADQLPGRLALQGMPGPAMTLRFRVLASGEERWSVVRAVPVFGADGAVQGAINFFRDITERKRAERRMAAQYAVIRVLAESASLDEAGPRILQAIGEHLAWALGVLWMLDDQAGVLRCHTIWCSSALSPTTFEAVSRQICFPPGIGLPGTVWASGEPLWLPDVRAARNFPRLELAAAAGLRAAFAFPIRCGRRSFGAIEFFSPAIQPPDDDLLQMLAALGSQIGQFIERTAAEVALRASEARKTAILETALDCIITIDQHGRITEFNPAAEQTFGYRREAVLGRELAELIIPPALRAKHRAGLARYLATGTSTLLGRRVELPALRADGSEFLIELAITRLPGDGPPLFTGFARDITARKHTEEIQHFLGEASRLLASSLDYETTLASVARLAVPFLADWCAIHTLEEDGSVRRLAVAHVDPQKEALALARPQRYPLDPNAQHIVPEVLRSGRSELFSEVPDSLLVASARDDGHLKLLRALGFKSYMCVPLIAHGRTLGALTLVLAGSERRYGPNDLAIAEELARRAAVAVDNARLYREAQEALRARELFLSIASHELKTPLTSLLGYAELLQRRTTREGTLSTRDQRALKVVLEQANRLHKLVTALLDLSRIQSGQLSIEHERVDLGALAQRVVEEVRSSLDRHTLAIESPPEPLFVEGDELRLEQVLQNLLQNAVKYSPAGGPIQVRVERNGPHVCVTVRDSGIGIPEAALPRLFQRFYRAHNVDARHISGLGIGLYVVKEIIALHGGEITVQSREGEGSVFTFRLPALAADLGSVHETDT